MNDKLQGVFREDSDALLDNGFLIKYVTRNHNSPPHWHRAMEIQYILNGKASIKADGKFYRLKAGDFLVIDSTKVHDVIYSIPQTMGITIHISKNFMRRYIPNIELLRFQCSRKNLLPEKIDAYEELCGYMKELTVLYVNQTASYELKSHALVLNLLACLVDHFSISAADTMSIKSYDKLSRMEQIYQYVEKHHSEGITLQDGADELGLNKDYFCRMFKNNMGISFISYVNQVRIDHIYQDLLQSPDSIQDIIERHGFFNQKLFYQLFKKRYDCTPVKLRKIAQADSAS